MSVELRQLRHVATVLVSNVDKKSVDGDVPVRLVNYTDVYYGDRITPDLELMAATATTEQCAKFAVLPGDTIITKDSESADDIAIPAFVERAEPDMVCGYHLALIRPKVDVNPRFLNWAIAATPSKEQFSIQANGMTRYGLTYDAIQSVRVPVPPLQEQRRIADFLDNQVARIDGATAARNRQLEALDTAIIAAAHAGVTGAGVGVSRKSNIPWAPTIPERWGSPRLNQVARMGTGHTPSRNEAEYWIDCYIPWLTTGDVHRFRHDEIDSINDAVLHISDLGLANSAAVLHPRGTVALSRTASAGFAILMDADMATSQDFATWTCGARLHNYFLLWCLRAMRRDLMQRLAMGSTHKTIYFPDLMSIKVPLPPLDEQVEIARSIAADAAATRAAMRALTKASDLLTEYKRSLITAAVTGEFDVSTASGRGIPA